MTRKALSVALTCVALSLAVGCSNARTGAGHEGYVFHDPLFLGKRAYVGTQVGPASTGLVWRQYVQNIDMRPQTYSEEYQILTRDNLNLAFQSHAKISLKAGSAKQLVEQFGAEEWYPTNVREQYRAAVRETVRGYDAYDVKSKSAEIADSLLATLQERFAGSPAVFESFSIGNIDYPQSVNTEIERKLAAQQALERMEAEQEIAQRRAEIRITEARGLADAQKIINGTLTPLYVQHEAVEAYRELATSPNTTFVIAPTSPQGTGMPIIMSAQ